MMPTSSKFVWPNHNEDFGVEQDFYAWLVASDHITNNYHEADWHYLPIWWNRYYLNSFMNNTDDDANERYKAALIDATMRAIINPHRTFTVCEYDPFVLQPWLPLDGLTVFTGSRRHTWGIDVPLLSTPHVAHSRPAEKRYLASFIGHLGTHAMREYMSDALTGRDDVHIEHGNRGEGAFVELMLNSHIALAPRGDGGASFRFYEAMQLGIVPLFLSDVDTRPFRRWLDWDDCTLYRDNCAGMYEYMTSYDHAELDAMGARAKAMYDEHLAYGRWCPYVMKELETV
jgi:hypothetical protein